MADVKCLIFSSSSSLVNITSSCNAMCNCDVKYYSPVCSKEDQLTFYSPCYAGCTAGDVLGDKVREFLFVDIDLIACIKLLFLNFCYMCMSY